MYPSGKGCNEKKKTYIVCTQQKSLSVALICFQGEIRKISINFGEKKKKTKGF